MSSGIQNAILMLLFLGLLTPPLSARQPVSSREIDRQVLRWTGQVGGVERILIRGDQVQVIHEKDPAAVFDTYYMTSPLPQRKTKLRFKKLRGRGKVKLLQKPNRKNGFTAVVLVKDGKRGADDYEFELSWKGPPATFAETASPRRSPETAVADAPAARADAVSLPASSRYVWPVRGDILSRFGAPRGSRRHEGLDIRGARGADVRAARSGRVVYSGSGMRGYGKTVVLDHGNGVRTLYAHNSRLLVRPGDRVRQGQVIARVGRTGRASTDHCHFEIQHNRRAVDPLAYLPQR